MRERRGPSARRANRRLRTEGLADRVVGLEVRPADEVDLPEVGRALQAEECVAGLHDLHVRALSSGKEILSVDVVCMPDVGDLAPLMLRLRALLAKRFDIHHSTVQVERVPCE